MSTVLLPAHPPRAHVRPETLEIHNDARIDNYFWLRERTAADVIEYLEAENEYTGAMMAHTEELQEQLYTEMRGRIQEADSSAPVPIDDYVYYHRTEEGQQYPIYCRKRGSLDAPEAGAPAINAPEEVLLDQNALAEGHEFCELGAFQVSPDHTLLAYSVDTNGGEVYTLYVKDLQSGELLAEAILNTYYGLEWGNDNRTLFYTTLDDAMRPCRLWRHTIGTHQPDGSDDVLLHFEPDERFFLGVYKSRSQRYIFMSLGSIVTDEVWFLPADAPTSELSVIHPREQGVEYWVEHHGSETQPERFFITTNDGARNFRVMEAPVETPGKAHWREWIAGRENVKIDGVEPFRNHVVVRERVNGLRQLRVIALESGDSHTVEFPEAVYTAWVDANPQFDTETLRFGYTSLTTPRTVFDYHMGNRTSAQIKQQPVLGGYNAAEYVTERLFATADDGTQVPISLVRRRDVAAQNQPGPLLLYGYGSYGASTDPSFKSNLVSLLDRGATYAIAHIRGGGDLGRPWYEGGKLLHKKNTFTDFIACAEHLLAQGYTTPDQLVAQGRSAGGLLMGAVTNMRPDLFAGIVAGVPFVDVISTMLDASIPLTVTEYEEWGNPNDVEYYAYMKSYSPYDNVEAKAYPAILATAGLNDPRVQYWEPAKWVAKLRAVKTDDNPLLLKTNMGAGHSGSSGRFDYLEEVAFEYAFMLKVWGKI